MSERMVTRKVISNKVVNVYELTDGTTKFLGTENLRGKIAEKELAKKYGVDKVVTEVIKTDFITYGLPVSKFMELATPINETK